MIFLLHFCFFSLYIIADDFIFLCGRFFDFVPHLVLLNASHYNLQYIVSAENHKISVEK